MKHLIVLNVNHYGWFPVLWNKIEKIQNFFVSAFNVFFSFSNAFEDYFIALIL